MSPMKKPPPPPTAVTPSAARIATLPHLRWGYGLLLVFMVGGLMLEALHAIKLGFYLDQSLRRELWVLAHAHGALLAVLNLAYAATAPALLPVERIGPIGRWLRFGALLMPLGFFLGGIGNSESDPSLFILLTPLGALMVLYTVGQCVRAAWRGPRPGG